MSDDDNIPHDGLDLDIDILDLLTDESTNELNNSVKKENKELSSSKVDSVIIDSLFNQMTSNQGEGSGDLSQDLVNWLKGKDKFPSNPLSGFLNNATTKAEYGMFFHMMSSFERMNNLGEFLSRSESVLFDPENIVHLSTDELEKRMVLANNLINGIQEGNRRTIKMIKDKKQDDDLEKLRMVMAAIPTNKLKDIILGLEKKD
jgi:hypothetical protein